MADGGGAVRSTGCAGPSTTGLRPAVPLPIFDGEDFRKTDHNSTPWPTGGCMLRVASCGRRATWRLIF